MIAADRPRIPDLSSSVYSVSDNESRFSSMLVRPLMITKPLPAASSVYSRATDSTDRRPGTSNTSSHKRKHIASSIYSRPADFADRLPTASTISSHGVGDVVEGPGGEMYRIIASEECECDGPCEFSHEPRVTRTPRNKGKGIDRRKYKATLSALIPVTEDPASGPSEAARNTKINHGHAKDSPVSNGSDAQIISAPAFAATYQELLTDITDFRT